MFFLLDGRGEDGVDRKINRWKAEKLRDHKLIHCSLTIALCLFSTVPVYLRSFKIIAKSLPQSFRAHLWALFYR